MASTIVSSNVINGFSVDDTPRRIRDELDNAASDIETLQGPIGASGTQAATGTNTTETDLATVSIPAATLDTNGMGVRITAWGSFGATANNKTVKLYFGSTAVASSGAVAGNNVKWVARSMVIRTGAATQDALGEFYHGTSVVAPTNSSPTETLSGAVTAKCTGTNGTAAANDIVLEGFVVERL